MKIQSEGESSLTVKTKNNVIAFNPVKAVAPETDIEALSEPGSAAESKAKKQLNLPGEFEISGILAQGFFTDDRTNVAYKIVIDETALVHFGNLKEVPTPNFFEKLGENVDIIVLVLNSDFDDAKAKTLIDKLDPRMALITGDETYFAGLTSKLSAKMAEEDVLTVTKSGLSDEKTEVVILKV